MWNLSCFRSVCLKSLQKTNRDLVSLLISLFRKSHILYVGSVLKKNCSYSCYKTHSSLKNYSSHMFLDSKSQKGSPFFVGLYDLGDIYFVTDRKLDCWGFGSEGESVDAYAFVGKWIVTTPASKGFTIYYEDSSY